MRLSGKTVPFILIFLLLFPCLIFAKSAVWKVTNGHQHLYLAGTMHLLKTEDYPLPVEFDKAFINSDTIVFETDMAALETPQFQQQMIVAMTLPENAPRIKQQLSTRTWQSLAEKLAKHGIPLQRLNNFKISMALLTLTLAEYRALGFTAQGVDAWFHEKAVQQNKAILALETPAAQLSFLSQMGNGNADEFVTYSLADMQSMPAYVAQLKQAWRQGDMITFSAIGIVPLKQDYPLIYETIIKARNDAWMHKIHQFITTQEIESVFVGALHLAGPDGLIAQLQRQGFNVQQLN